MIAIPKKEELKKIIFEAFKDVPKGDGLGARKCGSEHDYTSSFEQLEKMREADTEQHWWEYPQEVIESFTLDNSLIYNNKDGIKFHLPLLMTADLEGYGDSWEIAILAELLSQRSLKEEPSPFSKEYLPYLKGIRVSDIIEYDNFTSSQVHAIALYLLFVMHKNTLHCFFESDEYKREACEKRHKLVSPIHELNYQLSVEEALAIQAEQHRIVRDWFKIGGIEF